MPNDVSAIESVPVQFPCCGVPGIHMPRNYFRTLLQNVHASLAIEIDMVWLARPCAGSAMGVIGRAIYSEPSQARRARFENMASNLTSDKEASRSDSGSDEDTGYHTANLLFEYRWPPHDAYAETYMLQEQVVEYLEIRGFSRKYPGVCVFSAGSRRKSGYLFKSTLTLHSTASLMH